MSTLRVGIIGCGNISRAHLRGWAQVPDAKIAAYCDSDRSRAEERARQFGEAPVYTDYRAVMDRGDVDAVDLCLPHHLHAPVGIAAAQAGKHVLVEKPITESMEQAHALLAAVDRAGVTLMVEFPRRWSSSMQLAKKLLERGVIGDLCNLMERSLEPKNIVAQSARENSPWKLSKKDSGGGALMRDGIHDCDAIRWLVGADAKRVYAEVDHWVWNTPEVETTAHVLMRFANNAIVTLDKSWAALRPTYHDTVLLGTKGAITLRGQEVEVYTTDHHVQDPTLDDLLEPYSIGQAYAPARIGSGTIIRVPPPAENKAGIAGAVAHFTDCVLNHKEPVSSGRDGAKALEMVLSAYESVEQGRPVELPTW